MRVPAGEALEPPDGSQAAAAELRVRAQGGRPLLFGQQVGCECVCFVRMGRGNSRSLVWGVRLCFHRRVVAVLDLDVLLTAAETCGKIGDPVQITGEGKTMFLIAMFWICR